jgi:hypothetical protein
MKKIISQKDYQQEINKFVGLDINEINNFLDENLFVAGLSFISFSNDNIKILGLSGKLFYKKGDLSLGTTTILQGKEDLLLDFKKNSEIIKNSIKANSKKIVSIKFSNDSKKVTISFDDNATLEVETFSEEIRPLSFDDNGLKYAVYFGIENSVSKDPNYYRISF